jgi:hypothetical protein
MSAPSPPNHPRAATSLVLGALGVMVCAVLGPFAWILSRRTLLEIDEQPGRYGGRGMAQAGYILGIVGTVLLVVLLTLLLIVMIGDVLTVIE